MATPSDKRKFKVYVDEVKLRHTNHWDSDFMSRKDFEAYMRGESGPEDNRPTMGNDGDPEPLGLWQRFLRACLRRR